MKINKVRIKNFKKYESFELQLTDFDVLVGFNNSGKSTIMQALAVWQYCVIQFLEVNRKGKTGTQVLLPNFYAVPTPEFLILWNNKTDRWYPVDPKKPEIILIEIEVEWELDDRSVFELGVVLRYGSEQTIYIQPKGGWDAFYKLAKESELPRILYVPPFSGIEPTEEYRTDGAIRHLIGRGQPGAVLRNILFRVLDKEPNISKNNEWQELASKMKEWFAVDVLPPAYNKDSGIHIEQKIKKTIARKDGKSEIKEFDLVSEGSGFYQILTILGVLLGKERPTMVLLDEPDAHLHTELVRRMLRYFKAEKRFIQFVIATHSETLLREVEGATLVSILNNAPKRFQDSAQVIAAMSRVEMPTLVRVQQSPYVLYLEGEDDQRILAAWAKVLDKENVFSKFCPVPMHGGEKEEMIKRAKEHHTGLVLIVPSARKKQLILVDYDSEDAHHPRPSDKTCFEWTRKNIENYLLVPDAWLRTVADAQNRTAPLDEAIVQPILQNFFNSDRLTLLQGETWETIDALPFKGLNGKRRLFSDENSLYHQIYHATGISLPRSKVAINMLPSEIHKDVKDFFSRLEALVTN